MAAHLDKTSSTFVYANGLLMLSVIVFPFSTAVLGRFLNTSYATLPIVLYCATTLFHNIGWLAVISTATWPKDLSKDQAGRKKIMQTRRDITLAAMFNLVVAILAFWCD
jgi:uncharacterized membrane protein